MRRGAGTVAALILGFGIAAPACGEENNDLDLIPDAVQQQQPAPSALPDNAPPAPPAGARGRYYVEDAATLASLRGGLVVPFPPPAPFDWQNRTSADARDEWKLSEGVRLSISNRFNVTEQNNIDFPSHQNVRNDFREGYVTYQPVSQTYLEAGRINVRNGVALGFNPTDFFKTRTLVDQASLDPSVIREDRLGTLMVRGQTLWAGGSASIDFAPGLYSPTPIPVSLQSGLDPKFDRTNATNRLLLSVDADFADLSPRLLFYHETDQVTRVGLDLSRQLSQSVVAYAEWAGGMQPDEITQALRYGERVGTLPANAPALLPTDANNSFRNDVAIGGSWTSTQRLTLNLEYHYHQAGFSRQDWRNWFATGGAQSLVGAVTSELWYFRAFAADQQQPITRHQIFARATWTDALVSDLDLTAFAFVNLYDGSVLTQIAGNYYLSKAWTVGGYVSANLGSSRSERGSFPQAASLICQLVRYF